MHSFRHAMMAGAAVCAISAAGPALAQVRSFDIPAQPARTGIPEFGRQSGLQVLAAQAAVGDQKIAALKGEYEPREALKRILASTNLTIASDDGRTVTLAPQSQSAGGGADNNVVQELVVTAQKKQENIQVVPIAISAFSQADLTTRQVAGGPDLMTQVPNMTFTKTNFSGYSIQIRGIGTQAISVTTDPAVAVAFNNTPFIRNRFFEQEFYDLERLEVLRGPQGTLYGRNATAGVVNLISAKPTHEFEAKLSADVANYSSRRVEGMVNLPLVEDKAALRIAGAWTKRDGYVTNILTGKQTDGRDLWSTRVTLGLEPTERLKVNLIWEHFQENDDRLRSGKQLCHSDPGPSDINGIHVEPSSASITGTPTTGYVSQGCLPASLYSPDSFDTPNGYALAYYGALGAVGLPVFIQKNPYVSTFQSRDLRAIETHLTPDYEAKADTLELQWTLDLPWNLSLTSETGFNRDRIFSFEDYNRFDTSPNVFDPGGRDDNRYDLVDQNGVFCDPQLGCTNRLAAGDLSSAASKQFSQEFRLSSNFDGPFNFNLGGNFLRYDTVENYYVFVNTLSMWAGMFSPTWEPGVTDNSRCVQNGFYGPLISDPNVYYNAFGCIYTDPNDIHHLNDQGRNYFLSKNPYHLLSYSAFGEAYYQITPTLKLTAGLRWTVDKKTAPEIPSWLLAGSAEGVANWGDVASYGLPVRKVIDQEWREPTGRVAIDWRPTLHFTDETLVYASYVRGYKAGGANPPPAVVVFATVCPPQCDDFGAGQGIVEASLTHPETFKPEFVNAYEIGTKNTLLDGRLTANLSAFYYDYAGYQISEIVDRSALNLNFDAKVWGAELELDWRPLENLRLGFKGGYEHTRVADGMKAIDLMDRTAGKEGYMLFRPFPTLPSNCVVATWIATVAQPTGLCSAFILGLDPVTYLPYVPDPTETRLQAIPSGYPGYDPSQANGGQGFEKDLSGHELPNAPKYTATVTADYTLPLANNWMVTLHADLYHQSEAWTRIFNDPGYDKLKAYNNINIAAIFSNENAGWQVMAYVKNVLDKDNITGAFLNSDDTGLTTNVFLNEPRLYGVRVTKNWSGGTWRPALSEGGTFPLWVEFSGQVARGGAGTAGMAPYADTFPAGLDVRRVENVRLDRSGLEELRLSYRPSGSAWSATAAVRYRKTPSRSAEVRLEDVAGPRVCSFPLTGHYGPTGHRLCDPTSDLYDPSWVADPKNRAGSVVSRNEEYTVADFSVGKDVGIGFFNTKHRISGGIRAADLESSVTGNMRAVTDLHVPDGWYFARFFSNPEYKSTLKHQSASFEGKQKFSGAGPTLSWEGSKDLFGNEDSGRLSIESSLTAGVLFGKQSARTKGLEGSEEFTLAYPSYADGDWRTGSYWPVPPVTEAPFDRRNSKSVTVPMVDLSLSVAYQTHGVRLGLGYRWERYFNAIGMAGEGDRSYDRAIDGPYFKIALGFGG